MELPVVNSLRRGRHRTDGRQRCRPQARQPHPADRRADPPDLREGRAARGTDPHGPRRRTDRRRAGQIQRRQDLLHRLRRGRKKVGVECAKRMKGSVLELGGKDPQIVCADADLANAVSGAVWGGFANAGQTCSGIERVYVVREVAERFVAGVAREAQRLRLGDPLVWETEIGPMTSEGQYETVIELVDDAIAAGATKLCGGATEVPGLPGKFIAPVVLTDVSHEMRIMREEVFGPVL